MSEIPSLRNLDLQSVGEPTGITDPTPAEMPAAPPPAPAPAAPPPRGPSALDVRASIGRGAVDGGGPDDREFIEPTDGFVAYDASGAVTGGRMPGAKTVAELLPGHSRGLGEILAHGDSGNPVTFDVAGDQDMARATTDGHGDATLPASALAGEFDILANPSRGGLMTVRAKSPMGTADAQVLALPRDYDGPIFVSDIDDTLRPTQIGDVLAGNTQAPIAGAPELLHDVADQGVPIVYLSAGPDRIRSENKRFLAQLPPGILLDRSDFGLSDLNPSGDAQARIQGDYKTQVLQQIRATYPNAKIFGIGDDKYGDAMAYQNAGATKSYIHDVEPTHSHVPSGFAGTLTKDYTPEFRAQVHADLAAAIAGSKSFS
jgi:hypothetical protein